MVTRATFLWRRMGSARLLLISAAVSTLVAAALIAALAGFAASSLPQAISSDLRQFAQIQSSAQQSARTTIAISGAFGASQSRADRPVVRAEMRHAFGPIPFQTQEAVWSDPIGLPSAGGHGISLVQAAALDQISRHARLSAGTWPRGQAPPGSPVPAAAPATVASTLHLRLGELLTLRDRQTGAKVRFRLTGVYEPLDLASPYWGLDLISPSGVSVQPGFITYGPLVVSARAFTGGALTVGGMTWLTVPDIGRIGAAQLVPLARRLSSALGRLSNASDFGGLQVSTGLPALLSGAATKLVVARSLLVICGLELALLAMAALALAARTLASQREGESAVLAARGSGRWQLVGLALAEALVVNLFAAAVGGVLGGRLAELIATTGPLRQAGLTVHGIPAAVWWAVGALVLANTAILAWPALHQVTPGAARLRRGRRSAAPALARAGGDVALVVLAVLAGWQLRKYSVIGRSVGGLGVDPVLAFAPAVALAAATVIPLRVLPALARAADRLAARTRRLGIAMTSWEISRRAVRQSAPMLLVVLAVGTGTLALAQYQSWRQSTADQSSFAVGAAVRADLSVPVGLRRAATIAQAPGVTAATPVTTSLALPQGGQALALDARQAPATVLLRPDQSALAPAVLWHRIIPARSPAALALPGRPARLRLNARLARAGRGDPRRYEVAVSVQDASGAVYSVPAGLLLADGRDHRVVAMLTTSRQAIYPLHLLTVSARYAPPQVLSPVVVTAAANELATFEVQDVAVSPRSDGGFTALPAAASDLAAWHQVTAEPWGNSAQLTLTPPVPFTVIGGIATQALLRANHLIVGSIVQLTSGNATIAVRIVAVVASFPTVTSPLGGLIVDQAAVQDIIAGQSASPAEVSGWWLATAGGKAPPDLPAGSVVTDRASLLGSLRTDPLSVIPQQAIQSIALAAAVLAALGFCVSVAGSIAERRSQSALLGALGVDTAAQTRLLCLEAGVLSVPAAATGLLLGLILAHLLVPAVTLTSSAAVPVPSPLVAVPIGTAAALACAVAAIPVLAAATRAAYRPDAAAQLRTAEEA